MGNNYYQSAKHSAHKPKKCDCETFNRSNEIEF